jgi:hypothetical protein
VKGSTGEHPHPPNQSWIADPIFNTIRAWARFVLNVVIGGASLSLYQQWAEHFRSAPLRFPAKSMRIGYLEARVHKPYLQRDHNVRIVQT